MRWNIALLCVLLRIGELTAAENTTFEILLSAAISDDPTGNDRRYVVIDGGYAEGLLEGMTTVVVDGDNGGKPVARLTIERADENESYGEAVAADEVDSVGLLRACAEHEGVAFETDPLDTVTLQKRAIEAFAVADYERAHFYLATLIEKGVANPSIHSTFWKVEKHVSADTLAALSAEEIEQEELMIPIYEHLAAHYYNECRFDRVMGVLDRIARVQPDHFILGAYVQALEGLAEVLPDSVWLALGERRFERYDPNQATLLYAPSPEISDDVRDQLESVTASLRCVIRGGGTVINVEIEESTGSSEVDQALVEAALHSVWRPPLWAHQKWGRYPGAGYGIWKVRVGG